MFGIYIDDDSNDDVRINSSRKEMSEKEHEVVSFSSGDVSDPSTLTLEEHPPVVPPPVSSTTQQTLSSSKRRQFLYVVPRRKELQLLIAQSGIAPFFE